MLLESMAAVFYALTSSLLPILPVGLGADATLDPMAPDLMASTSEIEGGRWPPCLCWVRDCTADWLEA